MPVRAQNGLWLPSRTTDPGSPSDGDIWLRSDRGNLRRRVGGVTLESGPSATWPLIASGAWQGNDAGAITTTTATQNRLFLMPFVVPRLTTLTGLAFEVTAGGVGSTVRGGLFDGDQVNMVPGPVVQDWGTVSGTGAAVLPFTIASPPTLLPGVLYFAAICAQGGAPTVRARSSQNPLITQVGGSNPNLAAAYTSTYASGVSGAFSGTPTIVGYINGPTLMFKFS